MIIIPMFTFSVLTAWSTYINKCTKYVFNNKYVIITIMCLLFICAFIGGIIDNFIAIVNLVDIFLMLMVLINVPSVIVLSNKIKNAVKEYNFKK